MAASMSTVLLAAGTKGKALRAAEQPRDDSPADRRRGRPRRPDIVIAAKENPPLAQDPQRDHREAHRQDGCAGSRRIPIAITT